MEYFSGVLTENEFVPARGIMEEFSKELNSSDSPYRYYRSRKPAQCTVYDFVVLTENLAGIVVDLYVVTMEDVNPRNRKYPPTRISENPRHHITARFDIEGRPFHTFSEELDNHGGIIKYAFNKIIDPHDYDLSDPDLAFLKKFMQPDDPEPIIA